MEIYVSIITLILFINFLLLSYLGFYLLTVREKRGALIYAILMFAVAIWAFFGAAENASLILSHRIIFAKLSYIGIVTVGPLWLLFVLKYTKARNSIFRAISIIVWLLCLGLFGLVLTNEYHNLVWTSYTLMGDTITEGVIFGHGLFWYVNLIFQYTLLLFGILILAWAARKRTSKNRKFIILIILATLIPWIGNFLFILMSVNITAGTDFAPISFAISGVIIVMSIYKYKYFSVVSLAINAVYRNIDVGIIVLDKTNHILDYNTAAEEKIGKKVVLGTALVKLEEIMGVALDGLVEERAKGHQAKCSNGRWVRIDVVDNVNSSGEVNGYSLAIYDIEKEMVAQENLNKQIKKLSISNDMMVGRELKMVELKKKIEELEGKNANKK